PHAHTRPLWMITATSTPPTAVMILYRLPTTTTPTMEEMASTEIQGSTGVMRATTFGNSRRTTRPPITGIRTTLTMSQAIAPAFNGMYCPANHSVSIGVSKGAKSVDTDVMVTDKATSPRAR